MKYFIKLIFIICGSVNKEFLKKYCIMDLRGKKSKSEFVFMCSIFCMCWVFLVCASMCMWNLTHVSMRALDNKFKWIKIISELIASCIIINDCKKCNDYKWQCKCERAFKNMHAHVFVSVNIFIIIQNIW